jgi:hypothetical protein
MGMVFGVLFGFLLGYLYYGVKLFTANRRIKQLEKEAARLEHPRF